MPNEGHHQAAWTRDCCTMTEMMNGRLMHFYPTVEDLDVKSLWEPSHIKTKRGERRTLKVQCTAWNSEIELLTSLIKLYQNERHSAPCGQMDAATQPPELATSPTSKKLWVSRAFEVRWTCTCCHDRAVFNCYSICHFLISVFSLLHWRCGKHQYRGTSPVCRRHIFNTVLV